MLPRLARARAKIQPYLRHWGTIALAAGFIFDNLTLKRIDQWYAQAALALYLLIAALGWLVVTASEAGRFRGRLGERGALATMIAAQFALGNLFSGFMIFYARSGAWIASWPFLLLLIGLLVGNEFLKHHYSRLVFRFAVLFLGFDLFLIFHLPIVFSRMGTDIFLLAGFASLAIIALYYYLSAQVASTIVTPAKRLIIITSVSLWVLLNLLYFTNILPPIPLSLKNAGVYHQLTRSGTEYAAASEVKPWYRRWWLTETIHYQTGQPLYVYSAVFAPTELDTTIIHDWQHYDEAAKRWLSEARIPIAISGGRDGGYRGYSLKSALRPGAWRVNVETTRGQLLGRLKFTAQLSPAPVPLTTIKL